MTARVCSTKIAVRGYTTPAGTAECAVQAAGDVAVNANLDHSDFYRGAGILPLFIFSLVT